MPVANFQAAQCFQRRPDAAEPAPREQRTEPKYKSGEK